MNNCCTNNKPSEKYPKKYCCPVNGKEYSNVKLHTMMHHIQKPWDFQLIDQGYYFCDDPGCDVVYFGQDKSIFRRNQIRTKIWQKEAEQSSTVCHCFGANHKQASENKNVLQFIKEQTKEGSCSCETSNPSGRCCLKDFPKDET